MPTTSTDYSFALLATVNCCPPSNDLIPIACRYLFHYICEDGLVYMCMADYSFGKRIPFAYLLDIKHRFLEQYGQELGLESSTLPYAKNEFSKVLAKQMVTIPFVPFILSRLFFQMVGLNVYSKTKPNMDRYGRNTSRMTRMSTRSSM